MATIIQRLIITEPIEVCGKKIALIDSKIGKTEIVKFDNEDVAVAYTSNASGLQIVTIQNWKDRKLIWQKAQQQQK
jgi:hypothetical protein